jgi:hypothetical protein
MPFAIHPVSVCPDLPPLTTSNSAMLTAMLTFAFALTALAAPGHAQSGGRLSSARAAPIHECSVAAGKYIEHTWADFEI